MLNLYPDHTLPGWELRAAPRGGLRRPFEQVGQGNLVDVLPTIRRNRPRKENACPSRS